MIVWIVFWIPGVGSLLAQTDTEREAERLIRDMQIDVMAPEPNVALPDIYTGPPTIFEQVIGGESEWKLCYFCRQHSSDELKTIVNEQFSSTIFKKEKNKATEKVITNYTVTSHPATNQLIVRAPTREDIDSVLEVLHKVDVAPVQVRIDCLISDLYADMTFDRETTIAIENLLGEGIALKPAGTAFGADVTQLIMDDEYLAAFPGASLREVQRSRMGLNIGYLDDDFATLVDMLESRGYLKILMNPSLEVINGQTAKISSTQHVAIDTITMSRTDSDYLETRTEYEDVIDSLEITPHVYADGSIGLDTTVVLGAKNTPDGVLQTPIVTKKEITTKGSRIRKGESLIFGGIRRTEDYAVIRGIPFLKDLPLIGFLFSGEDVEQMSVETIFIFTPTISTGGRTKQDLMKDIQRKHTPSSLSGLSSMMMDPLGFKAREKTQDIERQEAESIRREAEIIKTHAEIEVRHANKRAEKAEEELKRIQTEAEKADSPGKSSEDGA